MSSVFPWFLVLCTSCCWSTTSSHNVDIVIDNSSCVGINTTSILPIECATFSQCFSRISDCILENTTLSFQPGTHSTTSFPSSGLVKIQDVAGVRIEGHNSIIACHGSNMGFMFRRVDRLQIQGLNFQNCGGLFMPRLVRSLIPSQAYSSQTFWDTHVTLVIADSYNVDLRQVSISNSIGYGLLTVNLLGNSSIHEITVSRSNYAAIGRYESDFGECENPDNVGCSGGNVVLLYEPEACSECSPGPHRLDVSSVVAEYGANLERWDVNLGIEVAGGLTISLRQEMQYFVAILIRDSTIASNTGKHAGNAALQLYSTNCNITFSNTSFLNGNADLEYYAYFSFSGGLYNVWGQFLDDEPFTKYLYIDNCTFANNSGLYGGAMYISSIVDDELTSTITSVLRISNCDIRENRGHSGIIRLGASKTRESSESINYLSITLSGTRIYRNGLLNPSNYKKLGEISTFEFFSKSALYGTNQDDLNLVGIVINDNRMRGLDVSTTERFYFSGSNYISGNVADNGGGMQLFRSSFLVQPESRLYITNNQATNYGGGIFIRDTSNTCFFQIRNVTNTSEPRIILRENNANLSGNSIFGGNVDLCQLNGVFSTDSLTAFRNLFDIPYNRSLTEITSNIRQLCFCRKQRPDCDIESKVISTFPGQGFSVSAVAIGQLNGTTADTAVSDIAHSRATLALGQQQETQELLTVCTQLNYTLSSRENEVTFIRLQTNYGKTHLPNGIVLSLEVHTAACPLGFSLDDQLMVCDCNEFLRSFDVKCFINQNDSIHSPFPVWVGYNSHEHLLLAHKSCPLQYCKSEPVNFTLEKADQQCLTGHSGILCGGCKVNLSAVFGTSACKDCSNSYLSLLLVFLIAGLLLVATMIYGDLTISQGYYNGLIFYANIVRIHHQYLFPPNHTNVVTVFIAWLNLDLGVEVCFYKGMDAYARTWLQYVFPAYVWILVIIIIFLGWHSKRAAKIFGSNAVQVLATLLLLSYTKIERIVLETWSSTFIEHENGSFSVWLADGNIPFVKGKHIWLGLMSLVVTVCFLVPFTFVLLCEYPLQAKFGTLMLRYKLTPLIDTFQGPYKTRFRWWSGAMLLVRGLLLLIFGLNTFGDPRLNLILIVSTCTIILGVMWNLGTIYKEKHINMIESFFLVNLGVLSAWTLYNRYSSTTFFLHQVIVSYSFVGSSLVIFLATIGGQVYFRLKKRFRKGKGDPTSTKHEPPIVRQTSLGAYRESALL